MPACVSRDWSVNDTGHQVHGLLGAHNRQPEQFFSDVCCVVLGTALVVGILLSEHTTAAVPLAIQCRSGPFFLLSALVFAKTVKTIYCMLTFAPLDPAAGSRRKQTHWWWITFWAMPLTAKKCLRRDTGCWSRLHRHSSAILFCIPYLHAETFSSPVSGLVKVLPPPQDGWSCCSGT